MGEYENHCMKSLLYSSAKFFYFFFNCIIVKYNIVIYIAVNTNLHCHAFLFKGLSQLIICSECQLEIVSQQKSHFMVYRRVCCFLMDRPTLSGDQ